MRTTNPAIYIVGDAAGGQQFTHLAEHHAGIVLRHAIFRMRWAKPSPVVPWCTYTDPELARVGLSETEAKERGIAHRVYRFPFADIDRARAEGETGGFAKIVTHPNGKLLGAAIVGPHAGELIAEYVLALSKGMNAKDLTGVIHAYPTLAQINRRVADQRLKEGLTPSSKRWIQRIFGLRESAREHRRAARDRRYPGGKIALVAAFASVVVAFFALDGQQYLSLDAVKANRDALLAFTDAHYVAALAIAFVVYVERSGVQPPRRTGALANDRLPLRPLGGHAAGRDRRDDRRDARVRRRALPVRRRGTPAHGRARREDQRGIHRERVQLPAVPPPRPGLSVLPGQSRAGLHDHQRAHVRAWRR